MPKRIELMFKAISVPPIAIPPSGSSALSPLLNGILYKVFFKKFTIGT
jgi:hypothetical protein